MQITKKDIIFDFIKGFSRSESMKNSFKNENDYWFAYILATRFNGRIVYDTQGQKFGCHIEDHIYTIEGIVIDDHKWLGWDTLFDEMKYIDTDVVPLDINRSQIFSIYASKVQKWNDKLNKEYLRSGGKLE